MEIPALKPQTFAAKFQALPPSEVLTACATMLDGFNICQNPENWKAYIQARYGRKYVAGRPDLSTAEEWMAQATALENRTSSDFTVYLNWQDPLGIAYLAKVCDLRINPAARCPAGSILARIYQDIPGFENTFNGDYHGTFFGVPITSPDTIFHACLVETYLGPGAIERSAVLFANAALCGEYAVQFLENYEPYLIPKHIEYRTSQDPDEEPLLLEAPPSELKDLLLQLGDNQDFFSCFVGFEGYNSPVGEGEFNPRQETRCFEISWFPVRFRPLLPQWPRKG